MLHKGAIFTYGIDYVLNIVYTSCCETVHGTDRGPGAGRPTAEAPPLPTLRAHLPLSRKPGSDKAEV